MNGKCEFRLQGAPLGCGWRASTVMRGKNDRRKKACGVHRLVALGQGWVDETDELVERRCDQERAIRNVVDDGNAHGCPRCGQLCFRRYPFPPEPDLLVCGFCVGFDALNADRDRAVLAAGSRDARCDDCREFDPVDCDCWCHDPDTSLRPVSGARVDTRTHKEAQT